jgi:ABC-type polysaccharide/polyol phosphate export permease
VLNPIFLILIYWIVFSKFLRIRIPAGRFEIPFLPYLLTGILPWLLFSEGLVRGASAIVDRGSIIKKIFIPTALFPLSVVFATFFNYLVGIVAFLIGLFIWKATFFNYLVGIVAFLIGLFIWKGNINIIHIVLFFSILGLQLIFTSGLALALASLTVYVRDLTQIIGLAMTTILYPIAAVPEQYRSYILFNPLTLFIEAYHDLLLYERMPGLDNLCILFVISIGSLWAGFILFRKLQPGFSDVL